MILDLISRLPLYEQVIPRAGKIAAAFAAAAPGDAPFEVREKTYALKEESTRRYEVHFHTIDLMMAQSGAEEIDLCPMNLLERAEALPNGGDGCKLNGAAQGTQVRLEAGAFCAIFPGEAHRVGGRLPDAERMEKWVVKVDCPDSFCMKEYE